LWLLSDLFVADAVLHYHIFAEGDVEIFDLGNNSNESLTMASDLDKKGFLLENS